MVVSGHAVEQRWRVSLETAKVKEINSEKRNGSKKLNSQCPGISLYDG